MALSDLLFVTICIPPTAVDYAIGWPFGSRSCKIVQYLVHVSTYGTVYTLVLLSLDRYLAVVYPVGSISLRTVRNASVAIIVTWIVVCGCCAPLLWAFDSVDLELGNDERRSVCTFDSLNHDEKMYQALFFVTSLAVPLGAIVWLYLNMLLRLWKGARAATQQRQQIRSVMTTSNKANNGNVVSLLFFTCCIRAGPCLLIVVLLVLVVGVRKLKNDHFRLLEVVNHCKNQARAITEATMALEVT